MVSWISLFFVFWVSDANAEISRCSDAELRTIEQARSAAELGDIEKSSLIIQRISFSCLRSKEAANEVVDTYARQCQFQPTSQSGAHILQFIYLSRAQERFCAEAFSYLREIQFNPVDYGARRAQIASIALGYAATQLEKAARLGKNEFCTPGLVSDEWVLNLYMSIHKFVEVGPTSVPRYENLHFIARQLISYLEPEDKESNQLVRLRGFLNSTTFGVGSCSKYIPAECCPNLR